jgi:hypothetical protein
MKKRKEEREKERKREREKGKKESQREGEIVKGRGRKGGREEKTENGVLQVK